MIVFFFCLYFLSLLRLVFILFVSCFEGNRILFCMSYIFNRNINMNIIIIICNSFVFQRADSNGDGILSVEEYQKILQEHNIRYARYIENIRITCFYFDVREMTKRMLAWFTSLKEGFKKVEISQWFAEPIQTQNWCQRPFLY